MKSKATIIALVFACSASAQGTFQNLDFESANPGTFSSFSVPVSNAMPYWTVTIGGVQQAGVGYNAFATGGPGVTLVGPPISAVDGNYSVLLEGSFPASIPSMSQTGMIPSGTESLLFEAQSGAGLLEVLVGTEVAPFTVVGGGANYTLYGANISAWAGQTEQLTFSALQDVSGPNNWEIDDISFSPNAVSEPSPLALTGIGGLLFALYRRFAAKRQ